MLCNIFTWKSFVWCLDEQNSFRSSVYMHYAGVQALIYVLGT